MPIRAGSVSFFKSVSVFGFLVGFLKVSIGFGIGFQNNTIADTLPFPRNGVWALEFALQIAAIRDSDIVTIDNL